jgi:hypothetical protein
VHKKPSTGKAKADLMEEGKAKMKEQYEEIQKAK